MENKKLVKLLQHDQIVIDEILNGLLKIEFSDNEDFYYFIRRLNILENDVFFTKYVNDIEYITILKKIFIRPISFVTINIRKISTNLFKKIKINKPLRQKNAKIVK